MEETQTIPFCLWVGKVARNTIWDLQKQVDVRLYVKSRALLAVQLARGVFTTRR